jgi:lysophospholipase L1-like esterase
MKLPLFLSLAFSLTAMQAGAMGRIGEYGRALVLGDSVAFAYIDSAGHEFDNPENFLGFAEQLENLLGLDAVDAGCPGETTGSFISSTAADFGCRAYRTQFPLHVAYNSTQLEFAQKFMRRNHDVRLVTLTLGANDVFLLNASCATQVDPASCVQAGVPALLAQVAGNLGRVLSDLRATGFDGAIVVTNYYSIDYNDAAVTGLTELVNAVIAASSRIYGASVADLFTAFETRAVNPAFGGNICNAGLLNASVHDQTLCDVHPSQSGHRLIAETIVRAIR